MIRNIYNLVDKAQNGLMSLTSTDGRIGLIAMPIRITPAEMKMMLETLKGLVFPLAINVRKIPIHTLYCVSRYVNHVGKLLALSVGSVFCHSCSRYFTVTIAHKIKCH